MARRGRSGVAVLAAAMLGLLLVGSELALQETGRVTGRPVSGIGCRLIARFTPWELEGWACLAAPVVVLLVVGLVVDGLMSRRARH